MIDAKDALMEKIRNLDEKIAKKLLDEWDDIMLQIELESDESFLMEEHSRGLSKLLKEEEELTEKVKEVFKALGWKLEWKMISRKRE